MIRGLIVFLFFSFINGLSGQPPVMKNPDRINGRCYVESPEGKLTASGRCKNKQMVGVWKYYSPDGKLEKTIRYNNGKAGVTYLYNETGNKPILKITKKGKHVKLRKCNC